MAGYGYGISVCGTRVLGQSFAPLIPSDGLSLWLKADAGVSITPETFISQVVVSGAGTTTSNGTYTRASGGFDQFTGPNGNYIYWDEGTWRIYDETDGSDTYTIASYSFSGVWVEQNGSSPVPTSSTSTTPTGNTSVTAWADQSASGRNAVNNNGLPVYNLVGGKSFLSFGSYIDMLVPSTIWDNVQFVGTIFVVARFASSTSGTTARLLYQEGVDGNFVFSRGYNSTNSFAITTDEVDFVSSLTNADNNTNYILGATFGESNIATVYLNGLSDGTGGVTNNTGTLNTLIGGGEEPSSIAEMVVYNRVLTTEERQQVEQYLNSKYQIYPWRITISGAGTTTSNGEYVWDGITTENGLPVYRFSFEVFDIIFGIDNYWHIYSGPNDTFYYRSIDLITWTIENGDSPAPSATLYYTP
jgi:hypothetical protein